MNLNDIRDIYKSEGYEILDASSKACHDVILSKLAKSSLSKNATVKGGVIIQHISKNKRRATRDFDLDFVRYSLDNEAIATFIDTLNEIDDGVTINIVAPIEELSHQEYQGKRVFLELTDNQGNVIGTKLDIGVHKKAKLQQVEYCFELDSVDESVTLLGNSKEQMFTEKLASLLKHGRFSTRYKDVFDLYYFINTTGMDNDKLMQCFDEFIYSAEDMRENNISDIHKRVSSIFRYEAFLDRASTARNNWLELPISKVTKSILDFLRQKD
ncbi:MAG: nucleotidyl transferase AbiEii/AbiGii toxin family protein [Oscillospiraceae bacterium]|jgi:hypothetical protein|nr:nucleotidyl transferase AbiEii/AbiGii toxin family protein [Oscillospiraceae bacterium]